MNPIAFQSAPPGVRPPRPWFPFLPPDPPRSSAFWETRNVSNQLKEFRETLNLAKAMEKELEMLMAMKQNKEDDEEIENGSNNHCVSMFSKYLEDTRTDLEFQERFSVEAANSLMAKLRAQLVPFRFVSDETTSWEEKSFAVRLVNKAHKSKRNKLWRKRKRKRIAERLAQERERFEQADQEADEWRAREIAKDIAKRKVEKMNEIAKLKAKEERKRLESELELVLIVEKLQELRSIRIQKLKKQGHFLPEEDDKFLEKVRAAVEEEERQALAAADTDAAKDAIATAEESRKTIDNSEAVSKDESNDDDGIERSKDQKPESLNKSETSDITDKQSGKNRFDRQGFAGVYDSVANLPMEFYHYYHGSNTDMGTLIEVRRTWDAYIRPGGSRIPGHWVQPPPPADEIWASYLVRSKTNDT
ncbi:U11/U12 small nuclear ribonucleoprotein 59 kDa protein isoform X2 [Mangifera indica]|uniref:U11/U12 small nuclear ribonucleoprotein 59 kDa protein isoform X2 n=1 Tax=Mangifera indica TaxID=29780 RepID=UPI001CFB8E0A|nr:U11/U12 small nuclear ribonucleoprotein 59 kDa protein isoform X2 [Mangifera indica]XP_044494563.1 U11/U12 small nuclear ribonucleoprotein 59 kDa protein isoform X2 [Mangifera indica]